MLDPLPSPPRASGEATARRAPSCAAGGPRTRLVGGRQLARFPTHGGAGSSAPASLSCSGPDRARLGRCGPHSRTSPCALGHRAGSTHAVGAFRSSVAPVGAARSACPYGKALVVPARFHVRVDFLERRSAPSRLSLLLSFAPLLERLLSRALCLCLTLLLRARTHKAPFLARRFATDGRAHLPRLGRQGASPAPLRDVS